METKKEYLEDLAFGAYDSEMQGWSYTIPEGFTAEIKDGQVIVKRAESEDEMIRKGLIDYLKADMEYNPSQYPQFYDRAIAYLEKQKEQKPTEKQDYSGLTDFERAIHRGFLCAGVENVPVTIIKETAQDCLAHIKPAEWSEEDERKLEKLSFLLTLSEVGEIITPTERTELGIFLRSRRPQPHWKPSEEQMYSLKNEVERNREIHNHSIGGNPNFLALKSLQDDLLKLK